MNDTKDTYDIIINIVQCSYYLADVVYILSPYVQPALTCHNRVSTLSV